MSEKSKREAIAWTALAFAMYFAMIGVTLVSAIKDSNRAAITEKEACRGK